MLVVELAGEDLEELVDDVEAFVEDLDALGDVEIVGGAPVERFEFWIVPEEFWGVEDFAVKVDEVAFDKDLAHFLGDLFAGEGNFAFLSEVGREFFCVIDGLLDQFFEGRQFHRLGNAMGDREFGQRAFVVEEDFVFFDFDRIAIGESELVELGFV